MTFRTLHKRVAPDLFKPLHARAYDFMKERPVGILATVDPDNNPHAATIYYAVADSLVVTFLTKRQTKKSDNLAHNNHAMLVVFDEQQQTTVQITGVVTEISDRKELNAVFRNTLRASLHSGRSAVPPIVKLHAGEFVAYQITPVQVRLSAYAHPDVRTPGPFTEVLDIPATHI